MNQACDLSILVMNLENINDPSYGSGGNPEIYKRKKSYWFHVSGNEFEKEEQMKKEKKRLEIEKNERIGKLKITLHELQEENKKLEMNDPDCELLMKTQLKLQEDLKHEEQQTRAVQAKKKLMKFQ
jgi:hypothetical protein